MGSLVCAQIWVGAAHTKGSQAETSLHKFDSRGTENPFLTLPYQGNEPRVFGLEVLHPTAYL